MVRGSVIGAALVACLGLAACGGQSARDQVARTITTFSRAVANGDANTACAQLAPSAVAKVARIAPCTRTMQVATGMLSGLERGWLRGIKVTSVTVNGASATATLRYGTQLQHTTLRKSSSRWLIVTSAR